MGAKILDFRLTKRRAMEIIRAAGEDSSKIYRSKHAPIRMGERGIDDLQVQRCLQRGKILREPKWNINARNFECVLRDISAGQRFEVIVAVDPTDPTGEVTIVTVQLCG